MTESQSLDPNTDGAAAAAPSSSQPQPPATPRWVKISGVVLVLLVVAVLAKLAFGGGMGGHGPGMHTGLGTSAGSVSTGPATAGPLKTLTSAR